LFQIVSSFLTFKISQGSVSTPLRCDGPLMIIIHYTISAESEGEKTLKIRQHLPKLLAIK